MTNRRIVITGVGAVTPVGTGREKLWDALMSATHGFAEVRSFDTTDYNVHVGAEVKDFHFAESLPDLDPSQFGKAGGFALGAAREALADAGLDPARLDARRGGVVMGTTSGEPNFIEQFNNAYIQNSQHQMGGALAQRYPCHNIALGIARTFGLAGVAPLVIPAACAAGNYAVAHAWEQLHLGRVDMMLAGGSDAFSRITYTGFARLMAIATDVVRPFDKNRLGMIPGEGAGVLVMETLEHAQQRGARIYAEVTGYGLSCDAYHMTGGHPEGRGAGAAMQRALAMSGIQPRDVDYISAHGTGTRSNDLNETVSVRRVFGEHAAKIPISSIKSMLGHTMGAASAIEAVVCAMAIERGMIPPTANFQEPDPECDLDYVPNQARRLDVRTVMSNAYAFGGANASLVLRALEE